MTNDKPEILIIDDSAVNIQSLAQLLQKKYQLKVATSGERGLEIAIDNPRLDLILLDIDMPEMSGYEVCRRLKTKEATEAIPVIFISSQTSTDDEAQAFEIGAVDFISKPFHPTIIEARINTHITLKRHSDKLKSMAMRDQLTDLYNRHYLMDIAPKKMSKAKRHGVPMCMTVIDIDFFKHINDRYGHDYGDEVLRNIASILSQFCRKEDILARFGGEEFVMMMEYCSAQDCYDKCEQMRLAIENLKPMKIDVTASFGITELSDSDISFDSFFSRADSAVYNAKRDGRNCVKLYKNQ